uniref:hypothetical protein n=1 Tax=Nocardia abscessus TaxID=120957 RepID=UPI0024541076
ETILANIAELGTRYDQVVIAGYPPFVKDVLDHAPEEVLRQDLRVLLARSGGGGGGAGGGAAAPPAPPPPPPPPAPGSGHLHQ